MQHFKMLLFLLAILLVAGVDAQEGETPETFTDCELEATYKDRMTCHNRAMNNLIFKKLKENVASLQVAAGDTLKVNYDIKIDDSGTSTLTSLKATNAATKNIVQEIVDGLEAVTPFQNSKGNPVAVSYGASRVFKMNANGELELYDWRDEQGIAEEADVPFATIENVPVYPGCKGDDNAKLKKCMSDKVSAFVAKHFDMKMIEALNLPPKDIALPYNSK